MNCRYRRAPAILAVLVMFPAAAGAEIVQMTVGVNVETVLDHVPFDGTDCPTPGVYTFTATWDTDEPANHTYSGTDPWLGAFQTSEWDLGTSLITLDGELELTGPTPLGGGVWVESTDLYDTINMAAYYGDDTGDSEWGVNLDLDAGALDGLSLPTNVAAADISALRFDWIGPRDRVSRNKCRIIVSGPAPEFFVLGPLISDSDTDTVADDVDNCPTVPNPTQANADGDGIGDACEADTDTDGTIDDYDNCPADFNADQSDNEDDGLGDACDSDDDNDGAADSADNCPVLANSDQANFDLDGLGDACDGDDDADGVLDGPDQCPSTPLAAIYNAQGCSGVQWVALQVGSCSAYSNHGRYVSAVVAAANAARNSGLLTSSERAVIVRAAAQSNCP